MACVAQQACLLLPLFHAGGRSGKTYTRSKALNSLWAFDLAQGRWEEVPQTGDRRGRPLPRFEQAAAQYTPGSEGVPGSRGLCEKKSASLHALAACPGRDEARCI